MEGSTHLVCEPPFDFHNNMYPVEERFMNNVINLIEQHKELARHLNFLTKGFHNLKEIVDKISEDNAITDA